MSHTLTCERDGHLHRDDLPVGPGTAAPRGEPGATPGPGTARRRGASTVGPTTSGWRFVSLPEVRWPALSLAGFATAALLHLWGGPAVLTAACFAACYVTGGWEPALTGLRALRTRQLDVDLLMVVAAVVAASIGQVLDGGLLIVIFATSGALEAVVTMRTRASVHSLLGLTPEVAARVDFQGAEETVPVTELAVGDRIRVRPGERVGADGTVVSGWSDVDQASVTGEPLPAPKRPGDEVYAGTVNGTGVLEVRVSAPASASVLARIVELVAGASATKARGQLIIETVERRYSLAVVAATVALVTVPLALGSPFQPTLLRAMTFMIVASPCAVVLATMPPLLSAIANAGRHGVLVKSAVVMEQVAHIGVVAFDKTGTLTTGTPRLSDLVVIPDAGVDADTVLALAGAAEVPSEHPLGRAVVAEAERRGLSLPRAAAFRSLPGRGVQAVVAGRRVEVTNAVPRPVPRSGGAAPTPAPAPPVDASIARLERQGRSTAAVLVDGETVAVLGFADQPRPSARLAVELVTAGTGRPPTLLTGDSAGAAALVATEVGITDVRAGLLPEDKVAAVADLRACGTPVAAVGDGVNDAPALATADVGVAVGRGGADLTLDTADVVLVGDDLTAVPAVIDIARQARRDVLQNLAVAVAVIGTLTVLDLVGHLSLPLGVAGHEGSTVVVGLNGLRLLAPGAWDRSLRTPLRDAPAGGDQPPEAS